MSCAPCQIVSLLSKNNVWHDNQIINILKNTPWFLFTTLSFLASGSDRRSLYIKHVFFRTDHEWGMALSTFERDLLLLHDVSINIIFVYLWFIEAR